MQEDREQDQVKKRLPFKEKIGYIVLLAGVGAIFYKFGYYFLVGILFITVGEREVVTVTRRVNTDDGYKYWFRAMSDSDSTALSIRSSSLQLHIGDKRRATVIPYLNTVVLGRIPVIGLIICGLMTAFGILIAIIAFWMILDINNKYTQRIKERYHRKYV